MKSSVLFFVVSVISYTYGGIVPASTTLVRSSSTIAHPTSLAYGHPSVAVGYSSPSVAVGYSSSPSVAVGYSSPLAYSAPVTYSHAVAPSLYSQQYFAPAHYSYSSPLYSHGPIFAQQSVIAQYPGVIAQHNPIAAQYPIAQLPVHGQQPIVQGPSQIPVQGGSPVIEAADFPSQSPAQAPQQSPILSGGGSGSIVDDDTVSIEAA